MRETIIFGTVASLFVVVFYLIVWLATHPASANYVYYTPVLGHGHSGFYINNYNDYMFANFLDQEKAQASKIHAGVQKIVPTGQNTTLVATFENAENITSKLTPLESKIAQVFLSTQTDNLSQVLTDLIGKFTLTTYNAMFDEVDTGLNDLLAEEDTYTFQPKVNISNNLVAFRITTNRTSKMVVKPTLGALQAKGTDEYLICTEDSWENNTHDAVPTEVLQRNCQTIGACCRGEQHRMDADDLNFVNLYTTSPKGSDYIFINYHTAHLSLFIEKCEIVIEAGGCVMHTYIAKSTNYQLMTGNMTFPLVHFIIPRIERNKECILILCGLTRGEKKDNKGWTSREHVIMVSPYYNENKRKSGGITQRKLLAAEPIAVSGYKWPISCNTKNQMIPYKRSRIHHHLRSVAGKGVTYCNSSMISDLQLGSIHGCYRVSDYKTYFQCPGLNITAKTENVNCTIEPSLEKDEDVLRIKVNMTGTGLVSVKGSDWNVVKKCSWQCKITIPKEEDIIVKCPDGATHQLLMNKVDIGCPFKDKFKGLPLYVCRATHRPKTLYFLLFWILVGFPMLYCTLTCIRFAIATLSKVVIAVKRKMDFKKGKCKYCNTFVPSVYEWQRHEGCRMGECPFCRKRFSVMGLQQHACNCLDKKSLLEKDEEAVNEVLLPKFLLFCGNLFSKARRGFGRALWLIISILVLVYLIKPVRGIEQVNLKPGLWEEERMEVEICQDSCIFLEDKCICDYNTKIGHTNRKLMSTTLESKSAKYTADVQAPWGNVHIEEGFKPKYSENSIKMSWTTEEKDEFGKIILSGRATSHLQLEPHTGISFELASDKSIEKRLLTINIIDFTQVYKTRFEYVTGDRELGDWMHGTCSGDCPDKCGCDTPTCLNTKWINSRNWHCNPTWCWRMDAGCTCCGTDIVSPFDKHLISKWKNEYEGTAYIACVEFSQGKRICDVISEGTVFEHGPYKVQLSEVTNIQRKLPTEIALKHHVTKEGIFDLLAIEEVLSAENLCKLESCAHGGAGDYQIFDLKAITGNNIDSEHFLTPKKELKKIKHSWMSWNGVVQRYTCSVGHWPTCETSGVVKNNQDAFENLLRISENFTSNFMFHSLHARLTPSVPTLELEARPIKGGGSVEVLIQVDGLTLEPKEAEITRLSIDLHGCTGCYGCITGISCYGTVLMEGVDQLNLHFKSETEHFQISGASVPVHTHNQTTFEIKGFTPININRICLSLEEGRNCKTCPKPVHSCTSVELRSPKEILLESRSTLKSTQVDKCGTGFQCWLGGVKNFFKNLSSALGNFLGKYLTSIFFMLLIFGIPLVLIFFGPKAFVCLKFCKKGRAIINRKNKMLKYEGILGLRKNMMQDLDPDDLRTLLRKDDKRN
ncbi:glycoprotein precursor [Soldado virus]|uniref:M polyprotein n=2 Tax=Soldado virus TaxID=426791 RepID=A0A191KWD3_9VIRU